MPLDLAAFDAVLKDDYRDVIVSLLNKKTKLLDLFTKNADTSLAADGRNVLYPIHTSRNVGVGAVGENKTLPVAGNQGTSIVKVTYKYNYGRIQLTEQTIKASKTSKGAFKKALELEMKFLINDLARTRNRQLWGYGVGIMARVSGSNVSGTTVNIKDPNGVAGAIGAGRLIQVNDVIAFVRNATPTSAADADIQAVNTVSSLSTDTNTLTLTAATGVTLNDNDMVVMAPANVSTESSVNKEVMGLQGIVDDTTYLTTLHNISRTTVTQYKSTVLTLNGALSFDVLQRADDLADEKGGMVSDLLSHHSVRREYLKLLMSAKRFVGEQVAKPDAGFIGAAIDKDVEWSGRPWKAERMCPYGMIFGIDRTNNVRYVNAEGEWADDDGTILLRTLNKDVYEGRFRVFDNFHNDRPDTCFRIDGVTATVDVTSAE